MRTARGAWAVLAAALLAGTAREAAAEPEELVHETTLSVSGYYRLRGFWIHDEDNFRRAAPVATDFVNGVKTGVSTPRNNKDTEFWDMRLMLNPDLKVTDNIHVKAQLRILDDFLFGSSTGNPLTLSTILRLSRELPFFS